MPHTKAFLKDFHDASVIHKNKDEITTYRLQKLQQYFNYVTSNQIECDVNKLILTHLSFNGIKYSARMGDFFAYYGEFKLIEYLVKFYSVVIDQQVMDCAMFGGDQQTIQYIQKIQPGLISDYSLFELPVMTDTVDKAIRRLDLCGTLQLRRVSRRFSAYREALVDQLILQLQSPASFDRIKALRGLISITRQLTEDVKRNIAEHIYKINFNNIAKKSFHFDDNPKKIITYDNKTQLLTEYLNLPTDHEIPSEPQADERCFDHSHIEKHLYLKLLHQLGCVSKYYEVFYDDTDPLGFTLADKFRLTLLSTFDRNESDQSKCAVVFIRSEIIQLQQEIQNRFDSNLYADDESGIEQQQSDIEQLVTFLSINLNAQHDTACVIKLIEYLLESLLPTNYPTLVDFYFVQLTHLLALVSNEILLTSIWPKFEILLDHCLPLWPFAKERKLEKSKNDERNIHYVQGLVGLFFNIFLPKLSQQQIQQLDAKINQFDQNPEQVNLSHYLSIAMMVYWEPYYTPVYLAKLARKVFYILKMREDMVLLEPLVNSNLMLNVIFYRLSLKNRLNQFVPHLLGYLDYSNKNIEVSLQLINLIIKYSTKQDRIHYFTTYEHSYSHPSNPLIATISKYYENANGLDYEGGANAHIIEDIRLENELLFKLLPSNVLADEALHKIWNKIFVITDSKFSTEIITLYCKFALLLPTSTVINFLLDRIDSIFSTLRNIFIKVGKREVIYHVFHIIDLILQRLSKDEAHRQKFNDLIGMLVSKTLSLERNYFKMTIVARLLPFPSQLQHDLVEYFTSISTKLNNVLKGAIKNFGTIRDVMRLLALVSLCLSEGDNVLLENILQLNRKAIQNISDNNFTMLQSQAHLIQCYVLLRANLSPQNKADLFRLVCDLFLTVIANYRKNYKNDRDFHENYKHIITLFLNLFDNNSDVDCFKNYLLPALSNIFWYLQDYLIVFLSHKLHYSKFNGSDKKIGYHLLFSLNEFHQVLCALLVSNPNKSIQQVLFCFTLMDFDKTRCIEFLNLKESDKAIDIVNMLAENHVSLMANSKPVHQIPHDQAKTVVDEPMQVVPPSMAMLIDSGNSVFSGATKRHAGVEDNKDNKARRTHSPPRPRQ